MRDKFFGDLEFWCREKGFIIKKDFVAFKDRKFAIDRAITIPKKPLCTDDLRIAIEWEGLHSEKSGHTTITGYSSNCEKYNRLSIEGWILLRYTATTHTQVFTDLNKILKLYV